MRICFLSNGYGEDRSAALMAKELKNRRPDCQVIGAPLLTEGLDYTSRGIEIVTTGVIPPSGGFPTMSAKGFLQDLPYTHRHVRYFRKLRSMRDQIDGLVVVGDIFLLLLGHFALKKKTVHFSLPKSNYNHPHFRIEEMIFRRYVAKVLTRDALTAEMLGKHGVNALYLGNPIMDDLTPKGIDLGSERLIGILPGSKDDAYPNFSKILKVVDLLGDAECACALSSSLDTDKMAAIASEEGWTCTDGILHKGRKRIRLVKGAFEDVISEAEVVIGLAGTANEQAVGLGKPTVSFLGCGPQTTEKRMTDQERMLGGSVRYIGKFPNSVAAEVAILLSNEKERARRAAIGMERMGSPGASSRVAQFLIEAFGA